MIDIGAEIMYKIVFFGDSVTEAHRNSSEPNDLGQGFVNNLAKKYENISFYNRGISGHKVHDLLTRVQQDVINVKPDFCFIWIGVNDAWLPYLFHQEKTLASYKNDYEKLIMKIKHDLEHTEIVLIKPFAIAIGEVKIDIYNDLVQLRNDVDSLAKVHKLKVIDIKSDVEQKLRFMPGEHLFHDGIHPTKEGHVLITQVLDRYFKEHIL